MGRRSQPPPSPPSTISDEMMQTSTIIVKNLPASADEELLELFFESTKKQGGGPVKSVKMLRDKNAAFVEFCENEAVQTVMKKRPLKFGTTEIEAQPFKPLLKGSEIISSVDLKGLPDEFTKELLKKNLDFLIPNQNSDKIDIVDISEYRQYHQGYEYLDKSSKSNATRKQLFGRSDIDDYNPFSPLT